MKTGNDSIYTFIVYFPYFYFHNEACLCYSMFLLHLFIYGYVRLSVCLSVQRNGADFSVYVTTAIEHDGSDSGGSPDEAVSWGKIKGTAKPVKVNHGMLLN